MSQDFAAELFAMVHREGDLGRDPVAAEPGDGPEIKAEAVGPGTLLGVGHQLEARGHIQGAPLEVGDAVAVEVGDLLPAQCLVVTDILQVYLHDLEGLGRIPVHKGTGRTGPVAAEGGCQAAPVPPHDMADGGPGEFQTFVCRQIEG